MKIGITQRVDYIEEYGEYRDSLDQNWSRLLESLNMIPVPLSNAIEEVSGYLDHLNLEGVILTGGNDHHSRTVFERKLLKAAVSNKIPIIGVCHGLQAINQYFGGKTIRSTSKTHVAVQHKIKIESNYLNLEKDKVYLVNSYHNQLINKDTLGNDLTILGTSEDNCIEAVYSTDLKVLGIMWHPEREIPFNERDINLILKHFGVNNEK